MNGIELIKSERERQIKSEGYTSEHDDLEVENALSMAASIYACPQSIRKDLMKHWPWDNEFYKPDNSNTLEGRIKELTKAGALIAAEIDKLERLRIRRSKVIISVNSEKHALVDSIDSEPCNSCSLKDQCDITKGLGICAGFNPKDNEHFEVIKNYV